MDGNQWRDVYAELKGCFKRSFEGNQGGTITDGSRYIVAPVPRLQMSVRGSQRMREAGAEW